MTKADYIQRKILAAVHNAFEYESYRKQCYLKRVQKNIIESDIVTDFPYNWAAPEEETPEHCLLKQEKKEQVWKALNRLNETQRTLIVAHYIHNQTYDYISKNMASKKQSPTHHQAGTECIAMSAGIEKVLPHRA